MCIGEPATLFDILTPAILKHQKVLEDALQPDWRTGGRKPEQLKPETYSIVNYREAECVSAVWSDLVARAGVCCR